MRHIATFAIFLATVEAQGPPAQPQPKADCALVGQVMNAVTGEPLRKAVVTLHGQGGQNMTYQRDVDSAGRFEFRNLAPGRYVLTARRTGFAEQGYGAKRPGSSHGSSLSLEQGQEMKNLAIKMTPQGVVTGRLTDEDGEPRAGVSINAMRFEWIGNRRELSSRGSAETNDLGEYRIYGLAPGAYIIQASLPQVFNPYVPSPDLSAKPEEGYVTTCYPGTADCSTAARVSVKAGTELRGIDFRMAKSRVVRISGIVQNGAAGKPARAAVTLMPRNKGFGAWLEMKQTSVDQHGAFEFRDISPGSYTLTAGFISQETRLSAMQMADVGDEHIRNLIVTVNPGSEVAGSLKIEGQEKIDSSAPAANIDLHLWDSNDMGAPSAYAMTKEDGSFKLTDLQSGRYRIRVYGI